MFEGGECVFKKNNDSFKNAVKTKLKTQQNIVATSRENLKNTQQELVKEHIIECAVNTFAQLGFEKASMRDVAKNAGYGVASLYSYFKSKEEILSVVINRSLNEIQTMYEISHPPAHFSLQEKIFFVLEEDMKISQNMPHLAKVRQSNLSPDKIPVLWNGQVTTVLNTVIGFLEQWFEKNVPEEERFFVSSALCAKYLVTLIVPVIAEISENTSEKKLNLIEAKFLAMERIEFFSAGLKGLQKLKCHKLMEKKTHAKK
jgi:AcrR family transcriptional regulator